MSNGQQNKKTGGKVSCRRLLAWEWWRKPYWACRSAGSLSAMSVQLALAFWMRLVKMVLTRICSRMSRSFLTLARMMPPSSGMKSMDTSGDRMIVRMGVLMHLSSHPRSTSLYRCRALLKSLMPCSR